VIAISNDCQQPAQAISSKLRGDPRERKIPTKLKNMKQVLKLTAMLASAVLAISADCSVAADNFTDNFNATITNSLDGSVQNGRHTDLVANDVLVRSGRTQMAIANNQLT
jgi:hypothetical protein